MVDIFLFCIFGIILPIVVLFVVLFVGLECVYENWLNPLPTFENGDKSDNSIKFVKTRKIK